MKFGNRALMVAFILPCLAMPVRGQKLPKAPTPPIRVGTDGVFVRILVTDVLNRYIAGLAKENFRIFVDRVEQPVRYFSQENAPVSIGIAFDLRSSLKNRIDAAGSAISRFLKAGNREDEFCLISFTQEGARLQTFKQNPLPLSDVEISKPKDRTPLQHAIATGLEQLRKGTNEKKSLIVITDGEFGKGPANPLEESEYAKLTDVQVYAISGRYRPGNIQSTISGMAGTRMFFPSFPSELDYYINLIHDEQRSQYVLGFSPANRTVDGRQRRIEVKLRPPKGFPKMIVNARQEYDPVVK
jgi:Ca-activated chloride channel family protein